MPAFARRSFLSLVGALSTLATSPRAFALALGLPPARGWAGYGDAIVIDSLGGPGVYGADDYAPLSVAALNDVRASGLTAVNLTVSGVGSYAVDYEKTIRNIGFWNEQVAAHPGALLEVRGAADIITAKRLGRLGLIYGFQDATPIGDDLERVDRFWNLGVRIFQLTYNRRNLVGDGCMEPKDVGLTEFGRRYVARLNARRALVDLSHAGVRTTLEAIAASKVPVAISHTGCAAVAPHPRNKTDGELRALAEKGGYVGIYLMPYLRTQGQPMAEDVLRHLEHAIEVCGADHVGIGTDGTISPVVVTDEFKKQFADEVNQRQKLGIGANGEDPNVYTFVPNLNVANRFEQIAEFLSARKHPSTQIGKILGGNFLRLVRDVWGA
jgi:membrane dipeptidase